MIKIGNNSYYCQVQIKVSFIPELFCPCCFNRDWCVPLVVVVINLMHVPKVHTKRLLVEKLFQLPNLILLPLHISICNLQIVQRHPRCHQFHYIICLLRTVYLERFPFICIHLQKIKRPHLFPSKVLANIIASYIPWPISLLLDQ